MKINNYLLGFAGILIFLALSHFFVVYKYFQLLIHHSIYYCQEMVKALGLGLPGGLGKAVFGFLAFASLFTLFRLLGTFYTIYSFKKTIREVKIRKVVNLTQLLEKLDLQEKVKIIQQKKPQAFCFGILNPKIYISTGLIKLMNIKKLGVILRHERYHLENKDPLTMLLASLADSLFPFFPILSDLSKIYWVDREIKADRAAIKQVSDKKSLTLVLQKLLRYEPAVSPVFASGIVSTNTIESRIRSLLSLKTSYKKVGRRNVFISIVSFTALVLLMVTPVNAVELHKEGHDVVMLCNETTTTLIQLQSKSSLYTPVNFTSAN